jgi:hypothetical protein
MVLTSLVETVFFLTSVIHCVLSMAFLFLKTILVFILRKTHFFKLNVFRKCDSSRINKQAELFLSSCVRKLLSLFIFTVRLSV